MTWHLVSCLFYNRPDEITSSDWANRKSASDVALVVVVVVGDRSTNNKTKRKTEERQQRGESRELISIMRPFNRTKWSRNDRNILNWSRPNELNLIEERFQLLFRFLWLMRNTMWKKHEKNHGSISFECQRRIHRIFGYHDSRWLTRNAMPSHFAFGAVTKSHFFFFDDHSVDYKEIITNSGVKKFDNFFSLSVVVARSVLEGIVARVLEIQLEHQVTVKCILHRHTFGRMFRFSIDSRLKLNLSIQTGEVTTISPLMWINQCIETCADGFPISNRIQNGNG